MYFLGRLTLALMGKKIHQIRTEVCNVNNKYTVKPAHDVSSIKQSSVLKGHLFPVP